MTTLAYLGIYEDAIETNVKKAEDLLEEIADVLDEWGIEYDLPDVDDYNESVQELLAEETFDFKHGVSNQIIRSYFVELAYIIDSASISDVLGEIKINTEFYINCDDSHLSFNLNGAPFVPYYGNNDFKTEFEWHISRILLDEIINSNLVYCPDEKTEEEILKSIVSDIRDDRLDKYDIVDFIDGDVIKGTVQELINSLNEM